MNLKKLAEASKQIPGKGGEVVRNLVDHAVLLEDLLEKLTCKLPAQPGDISRKLVLEHFQQILTGGPKICGNVAEIVVRRAINTLYDTVDTLKENNHEQ